MSPCPPWQPPHRKIDLRQQRPLLLLCPGQRKGRGICFRAGSDALGLHAARRALLSGTSLNCLSGVASCHDLLHCASATYKTLSSTQPEGCLITTDDNQKLRQLLDMTAALISSMDVARRGHTETDRTAWFSYKVFATRYMAIIHQLPQDFPALVVLTSILKPTASWSAITGP